MRKLKLIILLLALQLNVNAQTYFPLPDSNAVWTISSLAQGAIKGIYKHGIFGDTTINNLTYKKIYYNSDYNFNITNSMYCGAIRQFAKKVYRVNPGTTTEGTLYDFNLMVGDTAKCLSAGGNVFKEKVINIDFVLVNGQSRRRWIFPGEYWIEGIGSSFGLLDPLIQSFDFCRSLLCLSDAGMVTYQNASPACTSPAPYDCDGNFVSVKEIFKENNGSIIYPNPVSNTAILKTIIGLEDATLRIYDMLGQELLINTHLKGQEIKIIKDNLTTGSFYYTLTESGNSISTGKFIVE